MSHAIEEPRTPQVEFAFLLSQVLGEPRDRKCDAEELAERRDERVRSITRFAYERVPWYGRLMRDAGVIPEDIRTASDLSRLPASGHQQLLASPQDFLPRGIGAADLVELKTSGSSGVPRTIFHDVEGMIAGWAVKLRERAVREAFIERPQRYRSASLSMEGDSAQRVQDHFRVSAPAVWNLIPETRRFSTFEDPARIVQGLKEWKPDHIFGYGSAVGRLFRYVAETGDEFPLPQVVSFSSDSLSDFERHLIETEFEVPVLGIYGATEAFSIGFECREGPGYHVNQDATYVRVVGANGEDAAPGEPGSVLISNLVNRGTVLLNYRLGDVAALVPGPCACGRSLPRIRLLEGRDYAWIERPGATAVHPFRLSSALNRLGIERWQIVQPEIDRLIVRVLPTSEQDRASLVNAVRELVRDVIRPDLEAEVEFPAALDVTSSGKVLSFVSRL
jgi:phenylacetate-CoA ligase